MNNKIEEILRLLNHALNADYNTISKIMLTRYECTDELTDDPLIICQLNPTSNKSECGGLGLLNGILQMIDLPRIAAAIATTADGEQVIEEFVIYEH